MFQWNHQNALTFFTAFCFEKPVSTFSQNALNIYPLMTRVIITAFLVGIVFTSSICRSEAEQTAEYTGATPWIRQIQMTKDPSGNPVKLAIIGEGNFDFMVGGIYNSFVAFSEENNILAKYSSLNELHIYCFYPGNRCVSYDITIGKIVELDPKAYFNKTEVAQLTKKNDISDKTSNDISDKTSFGIPLLPYYWDFPETGVKLRTPKLWERAYIEFLSLFYNIFSTFLFMLWGLLSTPFIVSAYTIIKAGFTDIKKAFLNSRNLFGRLFHMFFGSFCIASIILVVTSLFSAVTFFLIWVTSESSLITKLFSFSLGTGLYYFFKYCVRGLFKKVYSFSCRKN